jgi:hypothetical protein
MRIIGGRSQVAGDHVILSITAQRDEQSGDVADACGYFCGAGERRRYLRVAEAPRWHQANPKGVLQVDFAIMAGRRIRQAGEDLKARPQMALGLDMSRLFHRPLPGLQPIVDRLLDAARLGQMVRNQLGLDCPGKPCFKRIGNAGSARRGSRSKVP